MSQERERSAEQVKRRGLWIAFATVCLDLLGFGIIIPIQPFYAEAFGASPTMVTWLGASYSLMQFVFVPFWGRLSDRVGRRPVILLSVLFSVAGYVLFGLAGSLGVLFASRMLSGFGNANIATAQAIIADTTTGADRAKGMGLIGAAFGLGFIFGPALGGLLGRYGLAWPAFAAAGLGALNFFFALVFLPETRQPAAKDAPVAARGGARGLARLERLRVYPGVLWLVLVLFVLTTGFALMEQAIGLFIERIWVPQAQTLTGDAQRAAFKEAAALSSYFLIAVGVTATVVQGGLIGRLARRFGELRLARVGLVLVSLGIAGIVGAGQLGSFGLMIPVAMIVAAGSGLATPSLNSLLSRAVGEQEQGELLGVGQSASALGRVVGPALSGLLFEVGRAWPFFASALMLVVALALTLPMGARLLKDR